MGSTPRICRGAQRGVGLIEVLVALLILSFGMLGLVRLQLWSLKNNESSLQRGMAVVQTHSIIDAMRAERTVAMNGGFNIGLDAEPESGTTFASQAVAAWRARLVDALGEEAKGGVACDGTSCTVTIRWNDERAGGSASQLIETEVQL